MWLKAHLWDVLQRQIINFQDTNPLIIIHFQDYIMLNLTLTFGTFHLPKMAPKKKSPPLHVSLHRIEMERIALAQRTRTRIALLLPHDQDNHEVAEVAGEKISHHYYCLPNFCFCVLLLLLNLLFMRLVLLQVQ